MMKKWTEWNGIIQNFKNSWSFRERLQKKKAIVNNENIEIVAIQFLCHALVKMSQFTPLSKDKV